MSRQRKAIIKIDASPGGSLTDVSADLNSWTLTLGRPMLSDSGSNDDWDTVLPGKRKGTGQFAGWYDSTSTKAARIIRAFNASMTSCSIQICPDTEGSPVRYYTGEVYFGDLALTGDGTALITWSAPFEFDGAANFTSVGT